MRRSSTQFVSMNNISSGRKSFWVPFERTGRQIELQLSRKNTSLNRDANAAGCLSDRFSHIEIQCTRKGFHQDGQVLETIGLGRSEHSASTMCHSQRIDAEINENGVQYRYSIDIAKCMPINDGSRHC